MKIASLDESQLTVKRSEADKKKEEAAAVCLLKHHLRRLTAFASSLLLFPMIRFKSTCEAPQCANILESSAGAILQPQPDALLNCVNG